MFIDSRSEMKFYENIAYPLYSCPSGGIHPEIPEHYKYENCQKYVDERIQRDREKYEQRSRENFREFFKRFDPFGNFGERDDPLDEEYEEYEERDEDYPFGVFGLKRSASEEDMKKAYHKAVRETHPDKTREDTEDEFRFVQEAYEYYKLMISSVF